MIWERTNAARCRLSGTAVTVDPGVRPTGQELWGYNFRSKPQGLRVLRRPQVSVPITKFYRPALLSLREPSAHGRSSVGQAGAHPSTARALEQWIPAGACPRAALCADPWAGMTVVDETAGSAAAYTFAASESNASYVMGWCPATEPRRAGKAACRLRRRLKR
jgi:hypothetical protein